MPTTVHEQIEQLHTPIDQLREYASSIQQELRDHNGTLPSISRYINGDENETISFSLITGTDSLRIHYVNKNKGQDSNRERDFVLDELGLWEPSNDEAALHGLDEKEFGDKTAESLVELLNKSKNKPAKGLGKTALRIRSTFAKK